jgi:putative membrane protein
MHSATDGWSFPAGLTAALVLLALIYLRGWLRVRRVASTSIPLWRVSAFVLGLLALWVALGSPLAAIDHELLIVHMVQHLLVAAVAPPLIWLSAPVLPMWLGVPRRVGLRAHAAIAGGVLRPLRLLLARTITPWLAASVTVLVWHVPTVFALAQRSPGWHWMQRASFLVTGLLFWWPVVRPWSAVPQLPRGAVPLYLFAATLPCDALSAFLVFCDRVVYRQYLAEPHHFGMSALADQQAAGAIMWVTITFLYVVPAIAMTVRALSPARRQGRTPTDANRQILPSDVRAGYQAGYDRPIRIPVKNTSAPPRTT